MMQTKWQAIILRFLLCATALLMGEISQAGIPLWTFTSNPKFPPNISLTQSGYAYVQYTVTNQAKKTKTLIMNPIPGITQMTTKGNCSSPFILANQQSCTLTLFVEGSQLVGNIDGGPVVCQKGSQFQCYQPGSHLSISVINARFGIIPKADANGTISPNMPQKVVANSSITFTAIPNNGYQIYQWYVDGNPVQWGGSTYTLNSINANHTVEVSFNQVATIFAGGENGQVYTSTDNGQIWTGTTPSPNNAVNGLYATSTNIYVASADNFVYKYSVSTQSWDKGKSPDDSPVLSVFVTTEGANPIIYAGTMKGQLRYSTDDRSSWNTLPLPTTKTAVNGIYVMDKTVYIASADGNVYYLDKIPPWQKISGPANSLSLQNIFVVNNKLYVNTTAIQIPPDSDGTGPREYVYVYDLTTQGSWSSFMDQTVYSLFVSPDGSTMLAGTQDGFIYSLVTGDLYGFITYTKINSVFYLSFAN